MRTHPRAQDRRHTGGAAALTLMLIVIAYAPAFMAQLPPYLVSPEYRIY